MIEHRYKSAPINLSYLTQVKIVTNKPLEPFELNESMEDPS